MSAKNFDFWNRCVVVTDDEFEYGNPPAFEPCKYDNGHGYYYCHKLSDYNDNLLYWSIILVTGYYQDACIDYREKSVVDEYAAENGIRYLVNLYDSSTKEELVDDVLEQLHCGDYPWFEGVTKEYLLDVIKNVEEVDEDDWENNEVMIENCADLIDEALAGIEEKEVNRRIDEIRDKYGYKEYGQVAVMSNGEAIYEELGK